MNAKIFSINYISTLSLTIFKPDWYPRKNDLIINLSLLDNFLMTCSKFIYYLVGLQLVLPRSDIY